MAKKKLPQFKTTALAANVATPEDVFFTLTRNPSHGYLRGQQQDVLREYTAIATKTSDVAFELPTGTGKTTVGLLIAEWRRRSTDKVAYLCLNNQLAGQVIAEASKLGVPVADVRGDKHSRDQAEVGKFLTGGAVAVSTYSNLFNINPVIKDCGLVVFDDAHGGEDYAADLWTVKVGATKHAGVYSGLVAALRPALSPAQFTEVTEGSDYENVQIADVVAHPECLTAVRGLLDEKKDFEFSWQQIRAKLDACLFLLSPWEVTIRPVIPPTHSHTAFSSIRQRIYLSATLGGKSDLQRAYGITEIDILRARSAQWGKRYIFVPGIFVEEDKTFDIAATIWNALPVKRAILIAPSDKDANDAFTNFEHKCAVPPARLGSEDIKDDLAPFTKSLNSMLVLGGRYDGLDLPDDDCRLLLLAGSPAATNALERHLTSKWKMGPVVRRKERTRLIQGMGRCTRSATDFAIVLWLGQSLVDLASSKFAVQQMPEELQRELAWGKEQTQSASDDPQVIVDMAVGLIEDRDYRKKANDAIAQMTAVSIKMEDDNDKDSFEHAGSEEVTFARSMWAGDYGFAFETARKIAEHAVSAPLAGYRGWWWYLASVAARLTDNKSAEIDCLWHSSKSGVHTGFAAHLLSGRKASKATAPDFSAPLNVEHIWDTLQSWGWAGPAFDQKIDSMLTYLQNNEATKFHQGLEILGKCVGAAAIRPTADGAPDVIWPFVDEFCFCFEAKTEKKPGGSIYKKDLEEAKLHPEWVKHHIGTSQSCEFAVIIVSPTPKIDKIAEPFVDGIFYSTPDSWRALGTSVAATLRNLRAKFAGRDYGEAGKEFAAEIVSAKLDFGALKSSFTMRALKADKN